MQKAGQQQTIFLMLALALLSLVLFFRTIISGGQPVRLLFFACFVAYPVLLGALSWLDYAKIIVAEPQAIARKPENWTLLASTKYQSWLGLSIPRRTCISWNRWLRIAIRSGMPDGSLTCFSYARPVRTLGCNSWDECALRQARLAFCWQLVMGEPQSRQGNTGRSYPYLNPEAQLSVVSSSSSTKR